MPKERGQGGERVRRRVRQVFGKGAARYLTSTRSGQHRLNTAAGPIRFYEMYTWVDGLSEEEKKLIRRSGQTVEGNTHQLVPGTKLELKLVRGRISRGLKDATGYAGAGGRKKKVPKPHIPSPEEILVRVLENLRAAGLAVSVRDRKPEVSNFAGSFRSVPGYGLCLDARGGDIHFLPTETRFFKPTRAELELAGETKRVRDLVVLPAGSERERQILGGRLRRFRTTKPTSVATAQALALESAIGRLVAQELPHWLKPPFNLVRHPDGSLSLRKNAGRIALLHASRALVNHTTIVGDFTAQGPHWRELDDAIRAAQSSADTASASVQSSPAATLPRPSAWRPERGPLPQPHKPRPRLQMPPPTRATGAESRPATISQVPDGVPDELLELCLSASESIRLERTIVLPAAVDLRAGRVRLTFWPIEGKAPMLRVPFEFCFGGGSESSGHLQLGTNDPLTVAFKHPPAEPDLVRVWASVLLAFADLTVWPEQELVHLTSRLTKRATSRAEGSGGTRMRHVPQRRRRYVGSTTSRIDFRTLREHLVVGHRRWLPDGWDASAEKTREAASLGIVLEPGQTWVKPHIRAGSIGHQRISVDWSPPPALAELA